MPKKRIRFSSVNTKELAIKKGISYEELGKRIREERLRKKHTQESLAELIDLTPAFIGHIERAERSLSVETLYKIGIALDVSLDYLLRDSIQDENEAVLDEVKDCLKDKSNEQLKAIVEVLRTVSVYI